MAHEPHSTPSDPAVPQQQPLALALEPAARTEWDAVDPVPALRECRAELATLAEQGQPGTDTLTDHLVEVIAGLEDVGTALRDGDATPASLRALLERCASDLEGARALVAQSRQIVDHSARLRARRTADAGRSAGPRELRAADGDGRA